MVRNTNLSLIMDFTQSNMKQKTCRFGHECTSGCGNDYDCPCQADHCCELTEDCDGCDEHYIEMSDKETIIKELFDMVYNWGKIGVVTDFESNAFRKVLKEVVALYE